MTRTPASARAAGSRFERITADYLAEHVSEFIDRRVKTGAKDRGDHAGVRCHGLRGVHECKNRLPEGHNVRCWFTDPPSDN